MRLVLCDNILPELFGRKCALIPFHFNITKLKLCKHRRAQSTTQSFATWSLLKLHFKSYAYEISTEKFDHLRNLVQPILMLHFAASRFQTGFRLYISKIEY